MCSAGHIRYHSEPSVITLYMQISYEYFRRGLLKEERDRDAESREISPLTHTHMQNCMKSSFEGGASLLCPSCQPIIILSYVCHHY